MRVHRIIFSVFICLLFMCTALAQEVSEALPDDPIYLAKRHIETAKLNAKVDPLEKAALHTEFAKERLAETKAMIAKGKPEFVGDLTKDYEEAVAGAINEINRAQSQGRNVSGALEAVERSTKKHTEVLTDLLDKVPEEAKPAIRRSIAVSKRGRNTALESLGKIQRGDMSGGRTERPERIERSERISRTRDIDRRGGFESSSRGISGGGRSGGGRSGGGGGKPSGRGR